MTSSRSPGLPQAAGAAGQTVEAVDPETGEIHEE